MKPVVLVVGSGARPSSAITRYFDLVYLATPNALRLALAIYARGADIVHFNAYDVACIVTAKLLGTRVVVQNPGKKPVWLADALIVRTAAEMDAFPGRDVAVVPEPIDAARLADDLTAIYSLVLPWPASQAG